MRYLIVLLVSVAAALLLGRRAPAQAEPRFDHAGLRWRILHGERFDVDRLMQVLVTLFVLWSAWVEIMALLWVVGGGPLGWWMIEGPALANIVALIAVPLLLRSAWTELDADPVRLRLRRPWGLRSLELPWDRITGVRTAGHALVIETVDRRLVLDAPQAEIPAILAAAQWLEAGRCAPSPPAPVPEPAPADLVALVSRAGARSAPRAAVE